MEEKKDFVKISTENGTYETVYFTPTHLRRKKWIPKNPKHVVSFIPGTIIDIAVKVGDTVAEGDRLMTFKAMKMDSLIYAEMAGKVKNICVALGDRVPKGELILEFE